MSYPRYSEYRESGVEWLGDVPTGWKSGNIRFYADMRTGHTPSRSNPEYWKNCSIPWFTLSDVWQLRDGKRKFLKETKAKISVLGLANSAAELLPEGTVVFSRTASVGYAGIMPQPMATSQDFWNWICGKKLTAEYLYWIFCALQPDFQNRLAMGSTHKTIYQSDAAGIQLPLPPLPEQRQIAAFLDRECARMDGLMAKQERLIALLREKRQALISQTVTRGLPPEAAEQAGLDPDTQLKDSGIEWLGEVPKGWRVMSFSHCVEIPGGQVDPTVSPFADYTMIAPNHIRSGTGEIISLETAREQAASSGKYLCRKGEVIYSKIRPALAKACICPKDHVLCSADMYPMRGRRGLSNDFLWRLLLTREFTAFAIMESDRVAMPKLNRETLSQIRLPVPPLPEQRAIVAYLDEACGRIDTLIAKAERAIALLRERRTALISAAVTGKIDVRGEEDAGEDQVSS